MKTSRSLPFGVPGFVLLVITATGLFAQTAGSGSIAGTVTDPAGAVVPGATVVVHSDDTGADRTLVTNGAGIYSAPFLQPGNYEVTASREGFSKAEHKGILLEVGRSLAIDFALTVQSETQTVSVTSETPIVDTDKTENSQEVTQDLVENLPIVGRRWDNFVLLTPGVTTDGGLVSYRGISGLYNNNSVDGANNNQAFFFGSPRTFNGALHLQPGLDSGISGQFEQLQLGVWPGSRRRGQRRDEVRDQLTAR